MINMLKLYGIAMLIIADLLLVKHLISQKKQTVQCVQEMTVFLGTVTYGVTEWKKTLEEAILIKQQTAFFPKLFQEGFLNYKKTLPLREALEQSLKELPLPEEVTGLLSQYFVVIGKHTKKDTEECYQHIRHQLEEQLISLQKEFPKAKKLITTGVCTTSAMAAILLL